MIISSCRACEVDISIFANIRRVWRVACFSFQLTPLNLSESWKQGWGGPHMHMAVSNRRAGCRGWCRQTSEIISADSQRHCSRSKAFNRRRWCSSPANLFSETLSSYAAAQPYCKNLLVPSERRSIHRLPNRIGRIKNTLSRMVSIEQHSLCESCWEKFY